jgi:hypothetical protein
VGEELEHGRESDPRQPLGLVKPLGLGHDDSLANTCRYNYPVLY